MKLEDFLMQREGVHKKRLGLEEEVDELQGELEKEQMLNRILGCVLHGSRVPRTCLSSLLPLQVQELLAELAMVEEEIIFLERKVEELKLNLFQEKKHSKEWQWRQTSHKQHRQHKHSRSLKSQQELGNFEEYHQISKADSRIHRTRDGRNASFGSISEIKSMFHRKTNAGEKAERSRCCSEQERSRCHRSENPNKLSEDLITCLINIFLKMHNASRSRVESELSAAITSKLSLSCMSSQRSSASNKSSSNSKTPPINFSDGRSTIPMVDDDPYSIMLPDPDETASMSGPYKRFIHFTESSLDMSCVSQCGPDIRRLRVLTNDLCTVDIGFLTYKQKLAFWINVYNACIMQAFLQHGVPPTQDKLLALLNKAVLNVGGIVLNALAIEHFILRHRYDCENGQTDEKEAHLRHAYGLGYPEPNVTFALCRGSWSSPALRVYTGEDVVNELERAKVEYLEASIGITCKKKIVLPKLLHWHMKDFADDIESLVEWIYSQLPRTGSLKRLIMDCLSGHTKTDVKKSVDVRRYEPEFRYLLPVLQESLQK